MLLECWLQAPNVLSLLGLAERTKSYGQRKAPKQLDIVVGNRLSAIILTPYQNDFRKPRFFSKKKFCRVLNLHFDFEKPLCAESSSPGHISPREKEYSSTSNNL